MFSPKKILFFLSFLFLFSISNSQNLVASFIADKTNGCAPFIVNFTNTSTGSISSVWQFGDGASSNTSNPNHTFYPNSQPYHIILYASDGVGNTDTASAFINVKAYAPYFDIQPNACPGEVLNFSIQGNSDPDNNVQWIFGDGQSSNSSSTQYGYADSGIYLVKLIVNNSNCDTVTDSNFISITNSVIPAVHLHPANMDYTICQGDNFPYYYDETFQILWDFGDGTTSNDPYPNHHYNSLGTYPIVATVTNECGNSGSLNFILDVTNSMLPSANFLINKNTVCPDEPFTLSGYSGSELSYKWLFDDNTQAVGKMVSHSFTQTGFHYFQMFATNNCGNTDTVQGSVNVVSSFNSIGFMSISPKISCPNTAIIFKAPSGFAHYQWTFGDGTYAIDQNDQHTYSGPGIYSVKLVLVNFCSDTLFFIDTVNITNSILPIASFHTSQQTYCPGSIVNFISNGANGTIKNYLWDFGDGSIDTLSNPLHEYLTSGIYPVSLIVENNCNNKDTIVSSLIVDTSAIPTADFAVSPGLHSCENSILSFQNLSSDSSVSWDFGDGNSTTTVDPTHVYYIPGNYIVKLTVTNNCGKQSTAAKLLRVSARYEPVAAIVLQDSIVCRDQIIYFESEPSSVAVNYLWSFGDGTQSNLQNPTKTYTNTGLFTVIQTVSNECGTRIDSIKIKINDSLSNAPLFLSCQEQSGELIFTWNAIQNAVNYELTFDNGNSWVVTGSTNTFTLSGLNVGDSISAKIRAIGACQKSVASAESTCVLTILSEKYKNTFALYPNPFIQNIHIDLIENVSGAKINLTTVLGESIYFVEVAKEQKKIILDLDFLPAGIYLIEMTNYNSTDQSILKKIIKL